MILTIDIGNSTTKFGAFDPESGRLEKFFAVETVRAQGAEEIFRKIEKHLDFEISAVVVSSVVRELENAYEKLGEKLFGKSPVFVDHTFDFGFSIDYEPAESCGSDRLIAAFAACEKYGAPVIVCDFGTATNIECVSRENVYRGGIIAPGIKTLASALFEKTSKLPWVEPEKPEKVIGNSTVRSIKSGIYFGYIGLVDGLIRRLKNELGEDAKIISTGGFAPLIGQESEFVRIIEENLVLEGLFLLFSKKNSIEAAKASEQAE